MRAFLAVLLVVLLAGQSAGQTALPTFPRDDTGTPAPPAATLQPSGKVEVVSPTAPLYTTPGPAYLTDPAGWGRTLALDTFAPAAGVVTAVPMWTGPQTALAFAVADAGGAAIDVYASADRGATFARTLATLALAGTNIPAANAQPLVGVWAEALGTGALGFSCGVAVTPNCYGIVGLLRNGQAILAANYAGLPAGVAVTVASLAVQGTTLVSLVGTAANVYTCRGTITQQAITGGTCSQLFVGALGAARGQLIAGFGNRRWVLTPPNNAAFYFSLDDGVTWTRTAFVLGGASTGMACDPPASGNVYRCWRAAGAAGVEQHTFMFPAVVPSPVLATSVNQAFQNVGLNTNAVGVIALGDNSYLSLPTGAGLPVQLSQDNGLNWRTVFTSTAALSCPATGCVGVGKEGALLTSTLTPTAAGRLVVSIPAGGAPGLSPSTAACKTQVTNSQGVAGADVAVAGVSIATLLARADRCAYVLHNTGTADARCNVSGAAATATTGKLIPAGQWYRADLEGQQAVNCIRTGGTSTTVNTLEVTP